MHTSVLDWLQQVRADLPDLFVRRRVLECGSYDINGSARVLFADCDYTGLDWRHGPGVDVVSLVHDYAPDDLYDVVVSTEMLEHDPYWSASVRRMCELLRPGGALLLTWASHSRPAHEVDTAPLGGYYCGLHPEAVQDVVAPYFGKVQADLARGGLDGWLLATDRLAVTARTGKGTLSVVIGTVGKPAMVRCCIGEMQQRATMPLEIVVVDNGSTTRESALLAELAELGKIDVLLHYPHAIGYAAAYNAGIKASHGEYVMLLNNDAWPTQKGWDARLVSVLESVPNAMLVTPTAPRVTWVHQCALGPQAADGTVKSVPRVAFVAVLLRRTTLDELGPLDEAFAVGAYEDDDYCERIMHAGGLILVDPAVWFFHISGVTMMSLYDDILPGNKRTFQDKWKGRSFFDGTTTINKEDSQ